MLQERGEDEKAVSSLGVRRSKIHLHLLGNLFTRIATYAALTRGTVVITSSDSLHLWASLRFSILGHPHVPPVPLYSPHMVPWPNLLLRLLDFHPLTTHNSVFPPLSSGSPCFITFSAGPISSDDTLVPNFCPALCSTTSPAYSTRILCSIWPNLISLSSLQALPLPNFPLFMNRTTVQSHNLDKKESPPTVRFLLEPQWQSITSYGFSLWHSMPSHVPFLTL